VPVLLVTKPHTEGNIRSNWFGFAAAVVSMLFFVLATARLLWSLWLRFRRPRYENLVG
jgi:hypothetical protein